MRWLIGLPFLALLLGLAGLGLWRLAVSEPVLDLEGLEWRAAAAAGAAAVSLAASAAAPSLGGSAVWVIAALPLWLLAAAGLLELGAMPTPAVLALRVLTLAWLLLPLGLITRQPVRDSEIRRALAANGVGPWRSFWMVGAGPAVKSRLGAFLLLAAFGLLLGGLVGLPPMLAPALLAPMGTPP